MPERAASQNAWVSANMPGHLDGCLGAWMSGSKAKGTDEGWMGTAELQRRAQPLNDPQRHTGA